MPNTITMHPNLFWFAPSELSQDAFLCWLLSWADDKYAEANPCMNRIGVSLLSSIYRIFGAVPPDSFSVVIKKQEASIDILCVVNNDTVILIEDKVGSTQHSNQLPRYKDYVSKTWPAIDNIILIYLQTGDQSDFSEVTKHGYAVYKRSDLLNILESSDGDEAIKTSDILENFRCYLREIEDDVNSYATLPLAEWISSWNAWKGFYSRLQIELNDGNWNYVANPSGGFLGFWWYWQGNDECNQYLQIEQEKFCFKIWVQDPTKRAELRTYWYETIIAEAPKHGLKLKRPDRFGNGEYMTVALLDQEHLITNAQGFIEIKDVCALIRSAEALLCACDQTKQLQ